MSCLPLNIIWPNSETEWKGTVELIFIKFFCWVNHYVFLGYSYCSITQPTLNDRIVRYFLSIVFIVTDENYINVKYLWPYSFLSLWWNSYTSSMCMCAKSLLCNPIDHSLPGSSVHGILQARTLEWVVMPSSRGSSWPRGRTTSLTSHVLASRFFTASAT